MTTSLAAPCDRTNATRVPSGDGAMLFSVFGVDQTAAGDPPRIGVCHRSPPRGKYTRALSALQKKPPLTPSKKFVKGLAST